MKFKNNSPIIIHRKKPRILIDQDDVLFDFMGDLLIQHNIITGQKRTKEECRCWDIKKYYGENILEIAKTEGFFRNLTPKHESLESFKRMYLSGKYEIRIVSASMPHAYYEKIESIKEHMKYFDINHFIACSDKGSIWGDYLIDDAVHNLNSFSKIGEGILFDRPHNQMTNDYKRVFTLTEAEKYIDEKEFL